MTDNEYICEFNFEFDIDYLYKLIQSELLKQPPPNLKPHQRYVVDDSYLSDIKQKYPLLSKVWNFYIFPPNQGLKPHIDAARKCALNIPISGVNRSITTFYRQDANLELTHHERGVLNWVDGNLEKTFEFEIRMPTLVRNDVPHGAISGNQQRIIVSWSVDPKYTFQQAKEIFKCYCR
jgi:hypothetical protein